MTDETRPVNRRVFLGRVAKKAAYVAPAAVVLQATRKANAGSGACLVQGSRCEQDVNGCCAGFTCQRPTTDPCVDMGMTGPICTCE
jgi:hypothetical protein